VAAELARFYIPSFAAQACSLSREHKQKIERKHKTKMDEKKEKIKFKSRLKAIMILKLIQKINSGGGGSFFIRRLS